MNLKSINLKKVLIVLLGFGLILTGSYSGPIIHRAYIKKTVGSKVYQMFSSKEMRGGGTGYSLEAPSGKSYIITNAHICKGAKDGLNLWAKSKRLKRPMKRRIIEISDETDLCIVENVPNSKGLSLANNIYINEKLTSVGYPLLMPLTLQSGFIIDKKNIKIANGMFPKPEECKGKKNNITKINTLFGPIEVCIATIKAYTSNITIFGGNSGSPVVNKYGNVVGTIFATNRRTNWGSFIPLEYIRNFISIY